MLVNGGATQTLTVSLSATPTFTSAVNIAVSGMPSGVAASPSTLSLFPGQLGQWTLTASNAAANSYPLTLTGSAGALSSSTAATLTITPALTNAKLSATTYAFGGDIVGAPLTRPVATVSNTGAGVLSLAPALAGDSSYSLTANGSCGATLKAGASCVVNVTYNPTVDSQGKTQTSTLNLHLGNVPPGTAQTVQLTGRASALASGTVISTANPQVALYSLTLPYQGSVVVNFGLDTNYGRQTWSKATTGNDETLNMLVAGMLPNSTYHMQASYTLANGVAVKDADHTFNTGRALIQPNLTVESTPGMAPQPGVEQLTLVSGSPGLVVADLLGNVLWSYAPSANSISYTVQGAKLLPNGNFLLGVGTASSYQLYDGPAAAEVIVAIREIDLAGNLVREITINDLNNELQAAGYNLVLQDLHHDVTPLPNGHWLLLANTTKEFADLPGFPGSTKVWGDVVVDVDQNLQPVWVWNEFNHFDVNRHPMGFPDWTHTNAVVYSPTDGNIMVSMRHQNWVVKVDYANGSGKGDVLWRLGEGGDFTLSKGTDPTDWQYAQHFPSLASSNSAGNFSLLLMDNGDDRIFPASVNCGSAGAPVCLYSTIPMFQLDEGARTATLAFHQILDPGLYSSWGGSADLLANGDIEYDLAGVGSHSEIFEVTPDPNPTTVWHMHTEGANAYRGYRIPSLYPGVQW